MLSLIRHRKCKSRKERDRERQAILQAVTTGHGGMEVDERTSSRVASHSNVQSSSRVNHIKQPILGTLRYINKQNLFDDDAAVMSEVDTSSTRITRGTKEKYSYENSVATRPRTSPSQPSRSPGPGGGFNYSNGKVCNNNNNNYLHKDDSGIMSEADTSSTRIKGGNITSFGIPSSFSKQESRIESDLSEYFITSSHQLPIDNCSMFKEDLEIISEANASSKKLLVKTPLPVVRTPSKTLEKPLGLVFLVYRGETKRALLPNEITTIDTVKALFVRSFGRALTMEYLDSPRVRIYIHDSSKDIFYELENLAEVKDRTILKLFETDQTGRGPSGLGANGLPPFTPTPFEANENYNEDLDYISHEYVCDQRRSLKHLEILTNFASNIDKGPRGSNECSSTLPQNTFFNLDFSPLHVVNRKSKSNISMARHFKNMETSSHTKTIPCQSKDISSGFMRETEGSIFESGYSSSPDGGSHGNESLVKKRDILDHFNITTEQVYSGSDPVNTAEAKERMMAMEQQLNHLTGMVHKAINNKKTISKKTVSFEKSVSFSDDTPQGILLKKEYTMDRSNFGNTGVDGRNEAKANADRRSDKSVLISLKPEVYNQLRGLQKSASELRQEVRVLRRLSQLQSMAMKDLVNDTYLKLREACMNFASQSNYEQDENVNEVGGGINNEDLVLLELNVLIKDLCIIELNVEEMRSGVINKKNKISVQDVESMAILLSRSSKSVLEMQKKIQPPPPQKKNLLPVVNEQEKRKDIFEGEIFNKLESAWKRCKKVTGTLVTLKRLASVQEQRVYSGGPMDISLSPTPSEIARLSIVEDKGKENCLDDLLDALQNYTNSEESNPELGFMNPNIQRGKLNPETYVSSNSSLNIPTNLPKSPLIRLPSCTSKEVGSPVKENMILNMSPICLFRNKKGAPPPPPPRTSSAISQKTMSFNKESHKNVTIAKGEMDSLPGTMIPPIEKKIDSVHNKLNSASLIQNNMNNFQEVYVSFSKSESSSSESINSQEGRCDIMGIILNQKMNNTSNSNPPPIPLKPDEIKNVSTKIRQDALEQRHQELLARQKQLQEQYQRLQVMQRKANNITAASTGVIRESASSLKKTSSDSSLTNVRGTNKSHFDSEPSSSFTLPHLSSKPLIIVENTYSNTLPHQNISSSFTHHHDTKLSQSILPKLNLQ